MSIFNLFRSKEDKVVEPVIDDRPKYARDDEEDDLETVPERKLSDISNRIFQRTPAVLPVISKISLGSGIAMDSNCCEPGDTQDLNPFQVGNSFLSFSQLSWYASQSFIGHQVCGIIAQHWLVEKVCRMPAEDAIRNGYGITVNGGEEVPDDALQALRDFDEERNINAQLLEFVTQGRVFGIRIAIFEVESDDPIEYYRNPFNPDGITPGSYKGISQVDPLWIRPVLDAEATSNPSSRHFYEPTWWAVGSRVIHRTHLVIFRTGIVSDALKSTYYYGGVPIPQKIYERVYAAERTANEAPQLAMAKRTFVYKANLAAAQANPRRFINRLTKMARMMTNFGVRVIGEEEEMTQQDTSLADFDALIASQYQLVAAAGDVPAVKLLGTTPKGFNATGEFEERSYHEKLRSLQVNDMNELVQRHHLLAIRSEIAPMKKIPVFSTKIVWNPIAGKTAKELAEERKLNAESGATYITAGVISTQEERARVIADPESGYNGLPEEIPEEELLPEENLFGNEEQNEFNAEQVESEAPVNEERE